MSSLRLHDRGTAPAELVWERYADLRRWAEWAPQIRSVRSDGGDRIVAGLTGRVQGPPGISVSFEVTAVDEAARTWSWRVRRGPVRLHLEHGVADDASTCLVVVGPLPVVLAYAPIARLALRRLVTP